MAVFGVRGMAGRFAVHLQEHLEDYRRATGGESFEHFLCPVTNRDEPGDLCLGHVVPEGLGKSSNVKVLQRADVDNFYGSVVEADMITAVTARTRTTADLILDPKLSRAFQPKIQVNGQDWEYYDNRGGRHGPNHTPVTMSDDKGQSREIVFKKTPEEIFEIEGELAHVVINRDSTPTMIAGLLKVAHLTMFRLVGYAYALSANGLWVGKDVLGKFFDENRGKPIAEAKVDLQDYFYEWRNAIRPISSTTGDYRGSVDDGKMIAVNGSSGLIYAIGVTVRTNNDLHQVLLPAAPMNKSFPGFLFRQIVLQPS